eukprot:scaffold16258_cov141-Isochrysis_galbana.AAC.8
MCGLAVGARTSRNGHTEQFHIHMDACIGDGDVRHHADQHTDGRTWLWLIGRHAQARDVQLCRRIRRVSQPSKLVGKAAQCIT